MVKFLFFQFIFFTAFTVMGQTFTPMPLPITHPSAPESNPSFTGNGRTLLYEAPIGDYDRQLVSITYQTGGNWSSPLAIPGISMKADKVYNGGAFITFEGNFIFFSSGRYGGIGSNDIWYLEKTGSSWTVPKNLGKPINSLLSESDPCLSPDGKFLYFVRSTDKKDSKGKPCGQIFVAERRGKESYLEPRALPAPINTGCDCNPRILADNSMTFASERPGGKGGYDQYKAEMGEDGTWSKPVPMSFINTPEDDLYISIPAGGDFVYLTTKAKVSTDICKTRIPENLHPNSILFLSGLVTDADTKLPLNAKILVQKEHVNKQNYTGTASNGTYSFFLPEKENYSLTFSAKGYSFITNNFMLDTLKKFKELKTDISLTPLKVNKEFMLEGISFEGNYSKPAASSINALNNLLKLLQENPTLNIEIQSHMDKVKIDSVSTEELTELASDTSFQIDGQQVTYPLAYHNDRTPKEAVEIKNFLENKGINSSRINAKGYGDKLPCNLSPELGVKCLNRRVSIKVLKL